MAEFCSHSGVTLHNLNLLEPGATRSLPSSIEYVVHLAAILGVDNVLKQPYRTLKENQLMHVAMLDYAQNLPNLKKFAFASTSEVYAGSLIHIGLPLPTPETVPLALTSIEEPRTSYMLSKIYGEAILLHSGLPYLIVRPHNIYGPRMGMAHVIPQLLKKAYDTSEPGHIEVSSVDHRRTFCYIDDAVAMFSGLLLSPSQCNATFNLGNEFPEITIGQLAELVIGTVGKKLQVKPLPPTPGSPERRAPDMRQMLDKTGLFAKTSIQEGLSRTYAWYKPTFEQHR